MEDIHALEVSKADRARWELVPQREREEKQVGGCRSWARHAGLVLVVHLCVHAGLGFPGLL